MDIEPIRIFLSHSSREKELAGDLKEQLEDYGFEVFLAHSDILGGDNWLTTLVREIRECDLFLVLLSKEFHRADFTDHEVGIAYSLRKSFLPVSIDGTVPYGFMSKYQAINAKEGITSGLVFELAVTIYARLKKSDIDIIESIVETYADSSSYKEANRRADVLFLFDKSFSKAQMNAIAEAFLNNNQIHNASSARSASLELLKKRYKDLTMDNKDKLGKWIQPNLD